MVRLVVGGAQEFNALAYGQRHPGTMQYLEEQAYRISDNLTDAGRNFFSNVQQLHQQFSGSDAMRQARAVLKMVQGVFQANEIRPLWDVGEFQAVGSVMQRWIMAEPTYRARYHNQLCDGFSDTYRDVEPGVVGRDHYDWRRANDGLMQDVKEDSDQPLLTWYLDPLKEGDRHLELDEKVDIKNVHNRLKYLVAQAILENTEDPGSIFGNKL